TAVKTGQSAQVYVGTSRSTARVELLGEAGDAEQRVFARLRLTKPLVAFGADRFVLRGSDVEGPAGAVLGGGIVPDAAPPRGKPRAARRAVLAALAAADAPGVIRASVEEAAPRPFPAHATASRFSIDGALLRRAADMLGGKGEIATITGRGE